MLVTADFTKDNNRNKKFKKNYNMLTLKSLNFNLQ